MVQPQRSPLPVSPDSHSFEVLHSADQVQQRIGELARTLRDDHRGQTVQMVIIEKGARRFAEALAEQVAADVIVSQISVRARRTQGTTLREVQLETDDLSPLRDAHVWVVDDIVDEGKTLDAVLGCVRSYAPRSVRSMVLVRRMTPDTSYPVDLYGFPVTEGWVVGFGMDLDGDLRDLDHLALYHPPSDAG